MKTSLRPTEWVLAVSLLLLIASFVLIAKINAHRASTAIDAASLVQEEILITVDGAVKKPGQYKINSGTTVEQALRKARLLPESNLETLPLKAIIEGPIHLRVEAYKEIKVSVAGAIANPVELELPLGSRICDLKSKVIFTDETEKAFFRRRKLLKYGDKIEVPKKTVEVKSAN